VPGRATGCLLSLSEDLPVAIIMVDTEDRIRDFLPQLDELVTEGLVILDDCEVIRYTGRDKHGNSHGGESAER
jgi:PII-like signaling protein